MRRLVVGMVVLPVTAGGSLAAHALAYRLVAPEAHERENLLTLTGHGYLSYAPLVLAVLAGLLVVALGTVVTATARGRARPRLSASPFFVLPLLGFAAQEHAERFVHDGSLSPATFVEPPFLVGLVLQVPFAFAVFLLARTLLAVAEVVGSALGVRSAARRLLPERRYVSSGATDLARIPVLALGYPERGPPALP
jgi:hypothetical protein